MIGRRGPENASFTNNELAEMGRLARAVAVTDPAALDVAAARGRFDAGAAAQGQEPRDPARLREERPGSKPITLRFVFNRPTAAIEPGEFDLVITCIGYRASSSPRARAYSPSAGRSAGRAAPSRPTAPTAIAVAQQVIAWLKERDPKSGPDPMPIAVDLAGWHRIDKAEVAAGAKLGRPRGEIDRLEGAAGHSRGLSG